MTVERDENGLTSGQRAWADSQVDGDDFHTIAVKAVRWEPAGDGYVLITAEAVADENDGVVTLRWYPPLSEAERDAEAAADAARVADEQRTAADDEVARRVAAEVERIQGDLNARVARLLDERLGILNEGSGVLVSEPEVVADEPEAADVAEAPATRRPRST